jgi:hypothetical protein
MYLVGTCKGNPCFTWEGHLGRGVRGRVEVVTLELSTKFLLSHVLGSGLICHLHEAHRPPSSPWTHPKGTPSVGGWSPLFTRPSWTSHGPISWSAALH